MAPGTTIEASRAERRSKRRSRHQTRNLLALPGALSIDFEPEQDSDHAAEHAKRGCCVQANALFEFPERNRIATASEP
jgi:hypothetical protein